MMAKTEAISKKRARHKASQCLDHLLAIQNNQCHWCECPLRRAKDNSKEGQIATIDHLLPMSLGGHSGLGNLVASCFECNKWRNIAWESYGLMLYGSAREIQRRLTGESKVAGKQFRQCRDGNSYASSHKAWKKIHRLIEQERIPWQAAMRLEPYQCDSCRWWHIRRTATVPPPGTPQTRH